VTILVFGAEGQIAKELALRSASRGVAAVCAGRATCDLAKPGAARAAIVERAPALVINAAAYTAVDKAEGEEALAARINAEAAGEIAAACAVRDIPLVHFSTDYVFDGAKSAPYVEGDRIAPLNAYGRTKALGETLVREAGARAAIVRTSWVYSAHGANFVRTMLRLARERDEIGVAADQHGGPTWARDAADAALDLGSRLAAGDAASAGIFHFSSCDHTTWADFAEAIFAAAHRRGSASARVKRIPAAEYPAAARRPMNSRLATGKIASLGIETHSWRESLEACLREMLV